MTRKRHTFKCAKTLRTPIKTLENQPLKFTPAICPLNVEEQKERFLKHGKLPQFVLKGSEDEIEQLYNHERNQIRFDLFSEAEHIIYTVRDKYGDGENFLEAAYGEKISKDDANEILALYLKENNLDGAMSIIWCTDLASSARMMWIGPHAKMNRPEARNFSFWIKNTDDNNFIREFGIRCLADHEIGTHFFRTFNDGLQPWYSDRRRWGIRGLQSLEQLRTEEGLAAINTILNAKARYLWGPAMLYYTACKAAEMSFKQLYDHLAQFITSPDNRWRHCMRVKRGLLDPNDLGGYGKDQCYFEGAVEILRNIDNLDFNVLMSGKMCVDEVSRCKRLARTDCTRLPAFMRIEKKYKKHLKQIAHINGVNLPHPRVSPPLAYIQRLKRGRRIGPETPQQVRIRGKKRNKKHKSKRLGASSSSESTGESEFEEINNIINRNSKSCMPWSHVSNLHTVNFIQASNSDYIENIVSNLDQCQDLNSVQDGSDLLNSNRSSPLSRTSSSCQSLKFVPNDSPEIDTSSIINTNEEQPVSTPDKEKEMEEFDRFSSRCSNCSKTSEQMVELVRTSRQGSSCSKTSQKTIELDKISRKSSGSSKTSEKTLEFDRTSQQGANSNEKTIEISKQIDESSADLLSESFNNNARESPRASLTTSVSFDCESNSDIITMQRTRTLSSLSSDMSTILADGEDNRSCSISVQDDVSQEVTTHRPQSGSSFSSSSTVLSDLPVMNSKSTNQSSVFHNTQSEFSMTYRSMFKSDSANSFTESGPEKFIYPDFKIERYLNSECSVYLTSSPSAKLPNILHRMQSSRLLGRRTQSAANRITTKSLPYLASTPPNFEFHKRKL